MYVRGLRRYRQISGRAEKFAAGKTTVCVDHHMTTEFFCDYNYVEPEEAATGQIIFDLLGIMGAKPIKRRGRLSLPP